MPTKPMMEDARQRMHASVEAVQRDLTAMRTGRASLAMIDSIRVDYYGTPTPLNQVGNLSIRHKQSGLGFRCQAKGNRTADCLFSGHLAFRRRSFPRRGTR